MSKAPKTAAKRGYARHPNTSPLSPAEFDEVLRLIDAARTRAVAAVNTTLIELYWSIGEYISRKIESAAWGEGVVDQLASYIARTHPTLRGFTRRNLFRMRQFYETYRGDEKVSALLTQLPWTHHLLVLSKSKRAEEREFYLRMATSEKWSRRELERQLAGSLFERVVLSPTKVSPPVRQLHPDAITVFKDCRRRASLEPACRLSCCLKRVGQRSPSSVVARTAHHQHTLTIHGRPSPCHVLVN